MNRAADGRGQGDQGQKLRDATDRLMGLAPDDVLEIFAREPARRERSQGRQAGRVEPEATENAELVGDAQHALYADDLRNPEMARPVSLARLLVVRRDLWKNRQVAVSRVVDKPAMKRRMHPSDIARSDKCALTLAARDDPLISQGAECALDSPQGKRERRSQLRLGR